MCHINSLATSEEHECILHILSSWVVSCDSVLMLVPLMQTFGLYLLILIVILCLSVFHSWILFYAEHYWLLNRAEWWILMAVGPALRGEFRSIRVSLCDSLVPLTTLAVSRCATEASWRFAFLHSRSSILVWLSAYGRLWYSPYLWLLDNACINWSRPSLPTMDVWYSPYFLLSTL